MLGKTILIGTLLFSPIQTLENEEPPTNEVEDFVATTYTSDTLGALVLTSESECTLTALDGISKSGVYVLSGSTLTVIFDKEVVVYELAVDGTFTKAASVGEDTLEEILSKWFSPETVATIITALSYIITFLCLAIKLTNLKKTNNLTLDDVKTSVLSEVKKTVDEATYETTKKSLDYLTETCKNQNEVLQLLIKCVALGQENTPESRLAILEAISKLGVIDNKLVENAKNEVEAQKAEEEKKLEDSNKAIDEVIEESGASI